MRHRLTLGLAPLQIPLAQVAVDLLTLSEYDPVSQVAADLAGRWQRQSGLWRR